MIDPTFYQPVLPSPPKSEVENISDPRLRGLARQVMAGMLPMEAKVTLGPKVGFVFASGILNPEWSMAPLEVAASRVLAMSGMQPEIGRHAFISGESDSERAAREKRERELGRAWADAASPEIEGWVGQRVNYVRDANAPSVEGVLVDVGICIMEIAEIECADSSVLVGRGGARMALLPKTQVVTEPAGMRPERPELAEVLARHDASEQPPKLSECSACKGWGTLLAGVTACPSCEGTGNVVERAEAEQGPRFTAEAYRDVDGDTIWAIQHGRHHQRFVMTSAISVADRGRDDVPAILVLECTAKGGPVEGRSRLGPNLPGTFTGEHDHARAIHNYIASLNEERLA